MNGLNQYPGPTTGMVSQAARDPGVLTRVDNINASLCDLHEKLSSFASKLAGEAQKDGSAARPMSHGIAGTLSAAETWLRQCHQIVDALHQAF